MKPEMKSDASGSRRGGPGLLILAAALVAGACTDRSSQAQEQGGEADGSVVPSEVQAVVERADRARVQGEEGAPIRLVEVSDFQCPFCAQYFEETYPAVDSQYIRTGVVNYVWVSYPNPGHPRAWQSIEAAFCAGAVGKFWPMHDLLFRRQSEWGEAEDLQDTFVGYAEELEIDAASYRSCLEEDLPWTLQIRDYQNTVRAGISSTPFFILADSVAIRGAAPIENFQAAIDTLLALREGSGGGEDQGGAPGGGTPDGETSEGGATDAGASDGGGS